MRAIIFYSVVWALGGLLVRLVYSILDTPSLSAANTIGWGITIMMVILGFFAGNDLHNKNVETHKKDEFVISVVLAGMSTTIVAYILLRSGENMKDFRIGMAWILGIICVIVTIISIFRKDAKQFNHKYVALAMVMGWAIGIVILTKDVTIPVILILCILAGRVIQLKWKSDKPVGNSIMGAVMGLMLMASIIIFAVIFADIGPKEMPLPIPLTTSPTTWALLVCAIGIGRRVGWNPKLSP
jgi:hypothetical protein